MVPVSLRGTLGALLVLLSLFVNMLSAETPPGILRGRIFTSDDRPLPGAHIVLHSLGRGTISDAHGAFVMNDVAAGQHQIVVSYVGYRAEVKEITVQSGASVDLIVRLTPVLIPTEPVVVTGNPHATDPLRSPQDVISLGGREMAHVESASLGKTLESLPGLYNLSAGSVAGKPVVRGHTSERVLLLSDGVALDYQQYGERHSPTVEVLSYDRVEVIRGAASLLYGSDGIGGAVNMIRHPFHFAGEGGFDVDGAVRTGYFSNNNEFYAGVRASGASKVLSFHASLVRRKADNFMTPDVAPYSVTLHRGDPKFTGEIPNTSFEQLNGSLALGLLSHAGVFSAAYDRYSSKNNFLLPDGLPIGIGLENHVVHLKGCMPFGHFILKPGFSYQRNIRQATRSGISYAWLPDSAVVDLLLDVATARVEVENIGLWNLSGTIGAEARYYDHENNGEVPLQPTGTFANYAAFAFEEWQKNRVTLNAGARFDHRTQTFLGTATNPLLPKDDHRAYSSVSGSIGIAYQLTEHLTSTASISRGFRTPSFFNLYVYGLHGGVFAFQIGNPALENETSLDVSGSIRFANDVLNAKGTVFQTTINKYIYLYNAPDHPLAPTNTAFVFAHDQADARITGLEISLEAALLEWLAVHGTYTGTASKFTSGPHSGRELPLMPPGRTTVGVEIRLPDVSVFAEPRLSCDVRILSGKNAAGIYEPFGQFDDGIGPDIPYGVCSTEGYTVVNAGFGFDLRVFAAPANIDIEATNLFNKAYRDFLDTYKGYALSPGRGINLRVSVPFRFG